MILMRDKNSNSKMMRNLLIALCPIIIFSFCKHGLIPYLENKVGLFGLFYSLLFILVPAITSFLIELLYARFILHKKNKELRDYIKSSYSIFPGLFLGLICPINLPISVLIIGAVVATILGKLVYGGFGNNIFNPALIGYIFIIACYPLYFSSDSYANKLEYDAVGGATPLTTVKTLDNIGSYEEIIDPYGDVGNFFAGFIPGAVGETSALLCTFAFFYLALTKTIKWQIPLTYVATVFLITFIVGITNGQGIYYPLFQIFSGGLMFGAVFMATDPVTSPTTKPAILISSIMMGILTIYLRFNSSFPEGVATSILTMNLLNPLLDKIGFKIKFDMKKIFIPLSILLILMVGLIININNKFNTSVVGDPNFNIISKDIVGTKVTYVVTEKGYGGNIKALVEFNNNKLVKFEILEHNESFYSKVKSEDFINKLISNVNNVENVDTVSGATITSSSLKKLLINVVDDYKKDGNVLQDSNVVVPQAKDFEILEQNIINDTTEYIVMQKGFSGKMKVKVSVQNNIITNFEIVEINDSYKDKVLNTTYISDLITNQDNLDSVDTVSGATITSKAIKNIFIELKGLSYE